MNQQLLRVYIRMFKPICKQKRQIHFCLFRLYKVLSFRQYLVFSHPYCTMHVLVLHYTVEHFIWYFFQTFLSRSFFVIIIYLTNRNLLTFFLLSRLLSIVYYIHNCRVCNNAIVVPSFSFIRNGWDKQMMVLDFRIHYSITTGKKRAIAGNDDDDIHRSQQTKWKKLCIFVWLCVSSEWPTNKLEAILLF